MATNNKNVLIEVKVKGTTEGTLDLKKIEKAQRSYLAAISPTGAALRQISTARRESTTTLKNEEKLAKSTAGSYNALSAQYSLNVAKLNQMSMAERTNTTAGKALTTQTLQLRNKMKAMQSSVGNNALEVGNYKENVKGAIMQSGLFSRQIAILTKVQEVLRAIVGKSTVAQEANTVATAEASVTQKGAATSTGLMTVANKAWTATTMAASGALRILKVALISTGLGAIVVVLGSLIAAFLSTQKGVDAVNRVLAPMKGFFQGIIGVVQNLALNIFSQLNDRSTIAINAMANGILHIRLLWNKLSGDTKEYNELQIKLTKNQEESAAAQARLNDKTSAFGKIISGTGDKLAASIKAQQRITELSIKIQESEINLNKQRAISLDYMKEQEVIAKDTSRSIGERDAAAQNAIKTSKELADYEMGILDTRIEKMKLEQSINDTSREEQKELADLEAERINKSTEDKRNQLKFISVISAASKASAADIKQYEDDLNAPTDSGEQDDAAAEKAEMDAQAAIDAKQKVQDKIDEWQSEQDDIDAETEEEKRELKLERLQEDADEELAMLDEQLANKLIAQEDYNTAVEALEKLLLSKKKALSKTEGKVHKDTSEGKVNESKKALGATTELLGKESTAGKAAAIGEATIDMWQGVGKVWASPSLLPEPLATASKIVNSGVALATGGKNVANIKAQKFASGGIVAGSSFSGDNIIANVNSGEMILNATQQRNLFDKANSTSSNGQIDSVAIANAVIQAISAIPVVVKESDITTAQKIVAVREKEFSH